VPGIAGAALVDLPVAITIEAIVAGIAIASRRAITNGASGSSPGSCISTALAIVFSRAVTAHDSRRERQEQERGEGKGTAHAEHDITGSRGSDDQSEEPRESASSIASEQPRGTALGSRPSKRTPRVPLALRVITP
jgi:hypothetical protein